MQILCRFIYGSWAWIFHGGPGTSPPWILGDSYKYYVNIIISNYNLNSSLLSKKYLYLSNPYYLQVLLVFGMPTFMKMFYSWGKARRQSLQSSWISYADIVEARKQRGRSGGSYTTVLIALLSLVPNFQYMRFLYDLRSDMGRQGGKWREHRETLTSQFQLSLRGVILQNHVNLLRLHALCAMRWTEPW